MDILVIGMEIFTIWHNNFFFCKRFLNVKVRSPNSESKIFTIYIRLQNTAITHLIGLGIDIYIYIYVKILQHL